MQKNGTSSQQDTISNALFRIRSPSQDRQRQFPTSVIGHSFIDKTIAENGADYILAVKGNQDNLEQAIQNTVHFEKPGSMPTPNSNFDPERWYKKQ